jgi:anti-sigma-K factor RskA
MGMHTQHVDDLIDEYALGILDPRDRDNVEQHVQACPPCRRAAEQTEEAAHLLAFAAPPVTPPNRCKLRLMEKVEREQFLATPTRRRSSLGRAALWANLAAFAALLVVGVWAVNLQNQINRIRVEAAAAQTQAALISRENVQLQTQVAAFEDFDQIMARSAAVRYLNGVGPAASATAETYMTPGENTALLVVRNLPELPAGKTYQVWVARPDMQQPLSTFAVDSPDELVKVKIAPPEPMDTYQEIMVTVEAAGGAATPSDETVLAGEL